MKILIVNGPNLNNLGQRNIDYYGSTTLASILENLSEAAGSLGVEIKHFQSNQEGKIVSEIGNNIDWANGILINPAAYTHTSIAIRDALSAINLPVIEIHLSNIYEREDFRHHSYVSPIAVGVISGFGNYSYELALNAMINTLKK